MMLLNGEKRMLPDRLPKQQENLKFKTSGANELTQNLCFAILY